MADTSLEDTVKVSGEMEALVVNKPTGGVGVITGVPAAKVQQGMSVVQSPERATTRFVSPTMKV